jgi:hypothetical protein
MRHSALDPSLSAWHGLHGSPVDFSAHPIHPPGQLVVVHDSPLKRQSWAHHGVRAFYISPSLSHYRSHTVFVPRTGATRVSDTLDHFPDPLFPFEGPSSDPVLPDPTSDRPSPSYDGLDLAGREFLDPDLGVCQVLRPDAPIFLSPQTGNRSAGPTLSPGWHPTLLYQSADGETHRSSVSEVARWVLAHSSPSNPPPPVPLLPLPPPRVPTPPMPIFPEPPPLPAPHSQ